MMSILSLLLLLSLVMVSALVPVPVPIAAVEDDDDDDDDARGADKVRDGDCCDVTEADEIPVALALWIPTGSKFLPFVVLLPYGVL